MIQIALPSLHVTWLCVTLLSVLYYIYCSEMWNQLDALTGLLNQNSYLNRTAEMRRSGNARRRQWGKGLNGSFGGKKRPHTL